MLRHIHTLLKYIEPYSDIFRTLCNSILCLTYCKMIRHIQSPVIKTTVFSRILGVFRRIYAYSATHRGKQLGVRGWPPLFFFKIKRNALILGKKALIESIFGLHFPFKMYF